MELRRYLYLFRRWWLLMVACIVVGASIGFAVTSRTSRYTTSAQLYIGTRLFEQDPSQLYAESGLNEVVQTLAEMIPSPSFAEQAISATGVDRSVGTVVSETKTSVVSGTTLIDVLVTDRDPVVAQKLANGISNAFAAQSNNYVPGAAPTAGTVPFESAYVFKDAPRPSVALSNGLTRKVVLGAVLGLIVAVLVVLLLDYLDITIREPGDVEDRVGLPVLGVVPMRPAAAPKPWITTATDGRVGSEGA